MTLPNNPPFTAPPANITQVNGAPVNPRQYYLFSSFADAQRIGALELAAIQKDFPTALGISMTISDGILGSPGFPPSYNSMFQRSVDPVADPANTSIWIINLQVQEIQIPAASPTIPAYTGPGVGTDVAGDMVDRQLQPDQEDVGPTGQWGGDTLYIRAIQPTNAGGGAAALSGYWNPAAA